MLLDAYPFHSVLGRMRTSATTSRAVSTFISFLENRYGIHFLYEAARFPFGPELEDVDHIASILERSGIIRAITEVSPMCDEPPLIKWGAQCATSHPETSGGLSFSNKRSAILAALAEALERYLWLETDDYAGKQRLAKVGDIQEGAIVPSRFVGYLSQQQKDDPRINTEDDLAYLWIDSYSWTTRSLRPVPAQVIGARFARHVYKKEPLIRPSITTGLATWPTRTGAVLRGALEIIERDAFMIMWLNQLSLPVVPAQAMYGTHAELNGLLNACAQYRLEVNFVQLLTDAPAHVVCAVVKDESDEGPPITIGMKAGRTFAECAEGALLEALRARTNARSRQKTQPLDPNIKPSDISQTQRVAYWAQKGRHAKLAFLTEGKRIVPPTDMPWESDNDDDLLQRIVSWCSESGYEIASVSLSSSKRNPLPWHVEMVVIPELQPMHQDERRPCIGGIRIREIPERFGFSPLPHPYTSEPHPFV